MPSSQAAISDSYSTPTVWAVSVKRLDACRNRLGIGKKSASKAVENEEKNT